MISLVIIIFQRGDDNRLLGAGCERKSRKMKICEVAAGVVPKGMYLMEEIARMPKISRQSAYENIKKEKDIRIIKFGRNIRVDKRSFHEWFHGDRGCGLPIEVYTAAQLSIMLRISRSTAYGLLENTRYFRVIRLGGIVRAHKFSFELVRR